MADERVRRPRLLDVARLAGVSRATASRVLAGNATVSPEFARAVRDAAEELDYQINPSARSLRSGLTGSIAIVIPASEMEWLAGPFVGAPVRGATKVLTAATIEPVLLLEDGTEQNLTRRYLAGGHVDAAIVILMSEAERAYQRFADIPMPIVYVGHPTADVERFTFVDVDNYTGGRLAARELFEAGRHQIALVCGPADNLPSNNRLRGFSDEAADWGVPVGPVVHSRFSVEGGADGMARILTRVQEIDGLFALSDLLAVGAIRVLNASGRKVPTDVAVIGFDDTVVATTANPPLTSVRLPFEDMGRAAAELALSAGNATRDSPPRHVLLPVSLTRRESA